jgi:hypothetical protein
MTLAEIRCAIVAVHAAASCLPWCGVACHGYGGYNSTAAPADCLAGGPCCAVCVQGLTADMTYHTFEDYKVVAANRSGCSPTGDCMACPGQSAINVSSNYRVFASSVCSHYQPSAEAHAAIQLRPGATNVQLIGPGVFTSAQWPLAPGAGFSVQGGVQFHQTANQSAPVAVLIQQPGHVEIDADAPTFATLVSIASANGRPLRLERKSSVRGSAADTTVGLANVVGHLSVVCTQRQSGVVVQETRATSRALTSKFDGCARVVNLTALLGMYGQAYDRLFFDDADPNEHSGLKRIATLAAFGAAACVGLVVTLLWDAWTHRDIKQKMH